MAQEFVLQHPGLGVGAVEHREITVTAALSSQAPDLSGHEPGFRPLVPGLVQHRRLPRAARRPEFFLLAVPVEPDHVVGRLQDAARGTIVLLQLHHPGVGIVALEIQDVPEVGPPPAVNALVRVADHRQVPVRLGQKVHQDVLGMVGVLVLVHQEVQETPPVLFQDGWELAEKPHRQEQEIVKVQRVVPLQARLVGGVHPRRQFLVLVVGGPGELRRADQRVFLP